MYVVRDLLKHDWRSLGRWTILNGSVWCVSAFLDRFFFRCSGGFFQTAKLNHVCVWCVFPTFLVSFFSNKLHAPGTGCQRENLSNKYQAELIVLRIAMISTLFVMKKCFEKWNTRTHLHIYTTPQYLYRCWSFGSNHQRILQENEKLLSFLFLYIF